MVCRRLTFPLAVLGLALVGLTAGCVFTPKEKQCQPGDPCYPPQYRPLTTPVAPLHNLNVAYYYHDTDAADRYGSLFDESLYKFEWRENPEDPAYTFYYYDDEVNATRGLFTDPEVSLIRLTFLTNSSDTLNATPSNVDGDPPGTLKISVTQIYLQVHKKDTDYTTNGTCDFYVAPVDTLDGVPQWKIIRWKDLTGSVAAAPFRGEPTASTSDPGSALMRAAALAKRLD